MDKKVLDSFRITPKIKQWYKIQAAKREKTSKQMLYEEAIIEYYQKNK